jgi:MFS family permease
MISSERVILFFTIWSSFCFGLVFLFTQTFAQIYAANYTWSPFQTGVVELAIVVGETVALFASVLQDHIYYHSSSRNKEHPGQPIAESRLYLSIPGSFLGLTAGLFWFTWTSYPHLLWILPTIGLGLIGFGISTIMLAATNYFIDCYSEYAASALAAAVFGENLVAAFLPLAGRTLYITFGNQWAGSVLGLVAFILSFLPIVLVLCGEKIRARSSFMLKATRR